MACPFTLGDATNALAQRLYDANEQFWTAAEKTLYVQEALRTWNALASYWRDEFIFPTVAGQQWYDITAVSNTLRPLTVTDNDLLQLMEYHLLEPPTVAYPLTWNGSAQFSVADLLTALQQARDEILGITGCTIKQQFVPIPGPGRVSVPVPNTVTEVRRVAYFPASNFGKPSVLWPDDVWALQCYQPDFTTQPGAIPTSWRTSTEPYIASPDGPLLTFDVNVPPGVPGQFEILTIDAQAPLSTLAASLVTIPDDWTWLLKWRALSILLSRESNAKDPLRAKYCEGRYRMALGLLTDAAALLSTSQNLLQARINNQPLQIDAVRAADEYRTGWQGEPPGQPSAVYTAGMNLIAFAPPPDAPGGVNYSITANVVRNAPLPLMASDCMPVGRDLFDVILDYAQHLSAFKMGGEEFLATQPLFERFMSEAALYNSKLSEMGQYQKVLWQRSQLEPALSPRYAADATPGG